MKLTLILLIVVAGGVSGFPFCPDGWIYYNKSCYLFAMDQAASFTQAHAYCRQNNATLVEVNDIHENTFLLHYVNNFKPTSWWIGLTDSQIEGEWKWVGSGVAPTFTYWSPGEPESAGGTTNEDCAAIYHPLNFKWVDAGCQAALMPLCEHALKSLTIIVWP